MIIMSFPTLNILSMVLLLPPAPAALVLAGLTLATLSALSAAAFLLIAVAGPPGGFGEDGRAVVEPAACAGVFSGEVGRGDDCKRSKYMYAVQLIATW